MKDMYSLIKDLVADFDSSEWIAILLLTPMTLSVSFLIVAFAISIM